MCYYFVERLQKLSKVFFIEKYFVFFVEVSLIFESLFAFGNREVEIIATGGFYIKEVGSFARFYSFGIDF